jgi:Protein of unknown function (DUF1097)
MWLAIAITVVVSVPFGSWLGNYGLPLWVAFIVWAEYFALGARPSALKVILPAYFLGVVTAAIIMTGYTLLARMTGGARILAEGDVAMLISMFVGFCIFMYAMRWFPVTQTGTLPYYNGISVTLGVFFTGAYSGAVAPDIDTALLPAVAGVGALLAGLLGAFLGWFNVTILFPRPVSEDPGTPAEPSGA